MRAGRPRLPIAAPAVMVLALASLALGACVTAEPYTIRLASAEERLPSPRFHVSQKGSEDKAWFFVVDFHDPDSGQRRWRISTSSLAYKADEIVYGQLPADWTTQAGPMPLEAGKKYKLEIYGEGDGHFRFRVGTDGRLTAGW